MKKYGILVVALSLMGSSAFARQQAAKVAVEYAKPFVESLKNDRTILEAFAEMRVAGKSVKDIAKVSDLSKVAERTKMIDAVKANKDLENVIALALTQLLNKPEYADFKNSPADLVDALKEAGTLSNEFVTALNSVAASMKDDVASESATQLANSTTEVENRATGAILDATRRELLANLNLRLEKGEVDAAVVQNFERAMDLLKQMSEMPNFQVMGGIFNPQGLATCIKKFGSEALAVYLAAGNVGAEAALAGSTPAQILKAMGDYLNHELSVTDGETRVLNSTDQEGSACPNFNSRWVNAA